MICIYILGMYFGSGKHIYIYIDIHTMGLIVWNRLWLPNPARVGNYWDSYETLLMRYGIRMEWRIYQVAQDFATIHSMFLKILQVNLVKYGISVDNTYYSTENYTRERERERECLFSGNFRWLIQPGNANEAILIETYWNTSCTWI